MTSQNCLRIGLVLQFSSKKISASHCHFPARASKKISPGQRIIRSWTRTAHAKPMPYDAPSTAMAAVLYAAHPEENYFRLSEPQGKQRQLIANARKEGAVLAGLQAGCQHETARTQTRRTRGQP